MARSTLIASNPAGPAQTAAERKPAAAANDSAAANAAHTLTREVAARYTWAAARISLATIFLWAFLDKLFGLGHETASADSWLNGGNPTEGFLSHSVGPFSGIYQDIAGATIVNVLFMAGLAAIGVALLSGIAMRFAAAAGALMMVLMWSASLPPENHVFMDDHIIYAIVLIGLALVRAGDTLGLGRIWSETALVKRLPWLN
ncbi:DoxX family membrane protein [Conexibacter sp. CPCC 206217]|uniref:DoxX family membrane protein n=1 Tax=Conexibacter sp. CPCC 206217 TaxID=3064574 RepID=UPI00271D341E|nr:DoxX family membrane protein [Conexibacter sp. CPCC 206217]MDO8209973.1 DoxX family membrane protein [Conexibacter sp. CPCC 206217]